MNRKEIVKQIHQLLQSPDIMYWYDRPVKAIVAKVFFGDDNEHMKSKEDVKQLFNKLTALFAQLGQDFKQDSLSFLKNGDEFADMVFRFKVQQDDIFVTNIIDAYENCNLDTIYRDSIALDEELIITKKDLGRFFDISYSHIRNNKERRAAVSEAFGVDDAFLDWCYGKSDVVSEKYIEDGFVRVDMFNVFVNESRIKHEDFAISIAETAGFESLDEALKRKIIVRGGKRKRVKRSDREGYTTRGGKEVRMAPTERRKRRKTQKKAARKRKATKSRALRKRKISMRKRRGLD